MKILSILFVATAALLTGLWFFGPKLISPVVKAEIIKQVELNTGAEFGIEKLKVSRFYPLKIQLNNVSLNWPEMGVDLNIRTVKARISGFNKFDVSIDITRPQINYKLIESPATSASKNKSTKAESSSALPFSRNINLTINITDGEIIANWGQKPLKLSPLSVHIKKQNALDFAGPIHLKVSTAAHWQLGDTPLSLPISLEAKNLIANEQSIKTNNANISIAGLLMSLAGKTNLTDMSQDWSGKLNIQDLSQLKVPPAFLPPGKWSGAVKASFRLVQSKQYPLYASADWDVNNLKGQLNWQTSEIFASGPMSIKTQGQLTYTNKLNINRFKLYSDLSKLHIKYKDYFNKPSGIALSIDAQGLTKNNVLLLKPSSAKFYKLKAQASGSISMLAGYNSNLKIQMNKTSLQGFEKLFPPLSQNPMQGLVELKAKLNGDLQSPEKLNITLAPIKLANVSTSIKYKNKKSGLYIEGPVKLSAIASLKAKGKQLKYASADFSADASLLSIRFKNDFKKTNKQALKLRLIARTNEKKLSISQGSLITSAGLLGFTGNISEFQKPKLHIKTEIKNLNLKNLTELAPSTKDFGLSGIFNAQLLLNGQYDFKKSMSKNNIYLNGSVAGIIPSFKYKSPKKVKPTKTVNDTKVSTVINDPLLPDWPLFKNSTVKYKLQIKQFQYNDIKAQGVLVHGLYKKGNVLSKGSISKLFDGSIKLNKAEISLLAPLPPTTVQLQLNGINISPVTNLALPKLKDQVAGLLSGNISAKLPFPSQKKFLTQIVAHGNINVLNSEMKTVSINKIISEKLKKIPQLGEQKLIKDEIMQGQVKSNFKMSKAVIELIDFQATDLRKNKLLAEGKFDLDMNVDMTGTLYLANPPVRGSVMTANADNFGRLVLPISIKGSLLSPSVDFAQATINKLLQNTVEHEKNKFIKTEGDKLKNQLQKSAKDKLKSLFK